MSRVSFRNKGLIDLRAVRTFGMSAKENENPIGFFGTGLKYAIAICLRMGCQITLWRGAERIEFKTSEVAMRGSAFRVVVMESEYEEVELGFTTDLGKLWEPWQAFRELYCNAMDEGGECLLGEVPPSADATTIWVSGEAFSALYASRNEIFLSAEPRWISAAVYVHERPTQEAYFRGIRAGRLPWPTIMTYDVRGPLELTEDRSIKNLFAYQLRVRDAILHSEDHKLIEAFLAAPVDSFEARLDFDGYAVPGEIFLSTIERLAFRTINNLSVLAVYKKHRKCILAPDPTPLTSVEQKQLAKAIGFCERFMWPVREYPIVVTTDLAEGVWGQAYEGSIYLSRSAFSYGTKIVAGTLIEEFLHLRNGFEDESRRLQNYLLNELVGMGEQVLGEPL